LVVNADPA
ncbi:hypothetical protein MKD33_17355, partial [Chromobacterium piscinae]